MANDEAGRSQRTEGPKSAFRGMGNGDIAVVTGFNNEGANDMLRSGRIHISSIEIRMAGFQLTSFGIEGNKVASPTLQGSKSPHPRFCRCAAGRCQCAAGEG